mmetsp:Transcript_22730/g.51902  ORF Transcript_22730/g.51902 Transcript_22730/m.51902 type:complete len:213 (-) Transcript_22730:103-741(-)
MPTNTPSGAASSAAAPKAYVFEPSAYAKAVMHACKHSVHTVTGVFIGRIKDNVVRISDAVPLFHSHSLAPMLKVAFMLIDQYCQQQGDLEIVGLYFASGQGSLEINPFKPIADKIASNCPAASAWAVDAAKLPEKKFALSGYFHSKDDWKAVGSDGVTLGSGDEALKEVARAISEMKYLEVVDFDDHLTDATLNWLNPSLFKGDKISGLKAD